MGVQALHALAGAADAAATAAGPSGRPAMAASRSARSGRARRRSAAVDLGLGVPHAAGGLEPADRRDHGLADQPVARRHRRAVVEQRRVAEHDGIAVGVAHHDLERTLRLAPEQFADRGDVVAARSATSLGRLTSAAAAAHAGRAAA